MKKVNSSISRADILDRIESCLQQVQQWKRLGVWEPCVEYSAKAEVLIELLEVDDCGSVGGFDRSRGQRQDRRWTLEERFEWLRKLK